MSSTNMSSSVSVRIVEFSVLFLVLVTSSSCLFPVSVTATTNIPALSNSSWALATTPNSSSTTIHVYAIHQDLNSSAANNGSRKTTISTPTTTAVKKMLVTKIEGLPSKTTPHQHFHQSSSPKTNFNLTNTSTTKPATITTTMAVVTTTTESIIGSPLDGWKQLLTKNYWKRRIYDTYYLMELLIPIASGIAISLAMATIFSIFRCLILRKRLKKKNRSRLDNHNREKFSDNTWMLLENSESEEDIV